MLGSEELCDKHFTSIHNPNFTNKKDLGIMTFWTISFLLKGNNNAYDPIIGNGFRTEKLLEDIGPVKRSTHVHLSNDGDEVTLSILDENEEWKEIYTFHIIIQKPIIVEPKRRML